jgi:hypothetical protein
MNDVAAQNCPQLPNPANRLNAAAPGLDDEQHASFKNRRPTLGRVMN